MASSAAGRATRRLNELQLLAGDQDLRIDGRVQLENFGDRDAGLVGDRGQRVAGLDNVDRSLGAVLLGVVVVAVLGLRRGIGVAERARDDDDHDHHSAGKGECGEDSGEGAGAFFHGTG